MEQVYPETVLVNPFCQISAAGRDDQIQADDKKGWYYAWSHIIADIRIEYTYHDYGAGYNQVWKDSREFIPPAPFYLFHQAWEIQVVAQKEENQVFGDVAYLEIPGQPDIQCI